MAQDITREQVNIGPVVYQWLLKEYETYNRNRRWYVFMGLMGVILVAYAVATANYLFALIIVLFAIIVYIHDLQQPQEVPFIITTTGIVLGRKYYRYNELASFWILYNPPEVKNLYFTLNNVIKHRLQVPLFDYDPRPIRDVLSQFLSEDLEQEEEPFSDRLARMWQL